MNNEIDIIEKRIKVLEIAVKTLSNYIFSNNFIGKGKMVKCKKCKNIWRTRSLYKIISCPSCHYSNKIKDILIKYDI